MLRAGFADPVLDAQRTFRVALDAMAHPGRVLTVAGPLETPAPLGPAAAALCLTLADLDTAIWLDPAAATPAVIEYVRFYCGSPLAATQRAADVALIADPGRCTAWGAFPEGTDEEPERGATVIIQVARLRPAASAKPGSGRWLTGPGIATETWLDVEGLPEAAWQWLGAVPGRFPRGLDAFLVAGDALAAIPRTTRIAGPIEGRTGTRVEV